MVGNFVKRDVNRRFLLSDISFSSFATVLLHNEISDHKTDDLPSQMILFSTGIPIVMHYFTFSSFKVYHIAPQQNKFRNVKPNVSQSGATIHNNVGFATVYFRNLTPKIAIAAYNFVFRFCYSKVTGTNNKQHSSGKSVPCLINAGISKEK